MGPCCVEGCDVSTEDTYYFEFPTSRLLRRKWLEVIPISGKLPLGTVVCSRHFNSNDYENVRGKVRLKRKVVPSLLLDQMTYSKENSSKSPTPTKDIAAESEKSPKSPVSSENPPDTCDSATVSVPSPVDAEKMIDEIQKRIAMPNNILIQNNKQNGVTSNSDTENMLKNIPLPPLDHREDIEDMITNYQIKNKVPNPALLADLLPAPSEAPTESVVIDDTIVIDDVKETEPVFIEISVGADGREGPAQGAEGGTDAGSQDCLMLLESVQVDVDPTTLLLAHDDEYYREQENEMHKKEDPISLLTSSDEDDVILQEPHVDTVEVSDETDEDDMPLVKLFKKEPGKKNDQKKKSKDLGKLLWGTGFDFFCSKCQFMTHDNIEYNKHLSDHAKVLQVCQICGYTSSSKSMFLRHTRIHKVEKKFKCHICDYRARHKMSLIFHLKNHNSGRVKKKNNSVKKDYKCKSCDFKSFSKAIVVKHLQTCKADKKYACQWCPYATKKKCDLRRHTMRRHLDVFPEPDKDCVPVT